MNRYLKIFLLRGLVFSGFGPIVLGIVHFILSLTLDGFSLSGTEVLLGIVSTYLLAFVQAGATVFNQIEEWPLAKSMLYHLGILYLSYVACYVINAWIPFDWIVVLIFTAIFVVTFFIIWVTVYFCVKATSKRFNRRLLQK